MADKWIPAKSAKEQRVVWLTGLGKHSGVYVEIVSDSEAPVLRRLNPATAPALPEWADAIATFTEKRWRITADFSCGTKCWLRSAKLPSFACEATGWEKRQGKSWVAMPDASFRWSTVFELEKSLQDVARKTLRRGLQGLRLTPWRCTAKDCPHTCGNADAKTWGLGSQAELLGHLTYYHRGSDQYSEKINEVWDQQLADEMEQREEGEALLALFKQSLTKHRYELKVKRTTPEMHVTRIRHIVEKRGCEVSRALANDEEVYSEVKEWPEDRSSHGHLSVSLRWLRKFTEVSVLEAALAQGASGAKRRRLDEGQTTDGLTPALADEPPVQTQLKCMANESNKEPGPTPPAAPKVDPENPLENLMRSVAKAADPVACILRRFCRQSAAGAHGGHSSTRETRKTAESCQSPCQDAHALAGDFAKVASGSLKAAQAISKACELSCDLLRPAASTMALQEVACSQTDEELEQAWLWAYCGVGDRLQRVQVIVSLCHEGLRRSADLRSLNELLQKLLVVAFSPHGSASDVLPSVDRLVECAVTEASGNDLSLAKLEFFARKAFVFQELLGQRGSGFSCGCVQFASFGGLLGSILRRSTSGVELHRHLEKFCRSRKHGTFQAWLYRVGFLTGLFWNYSPATALQDIEEKVLCSPVDCIGEEERAQLRSIQQKAWQKAKPEHKENQGPYLEERPVATPTRRTRNSSVQDLEAPVPRKLEEQLEEVDTQPPQRQAVPLHTIRNVDALCLTDGVKGQIRRRVPHANGSSFHLVLHDYSGQIQVKFWQGAAARYHSDPRLEEGCVVVLRNYKLQALKAEQLEFAPAGRRHCLSYDMAEAVSIELVQGVPRATVAEALQHPAHSRLSLHCYVTSVEELVERANSQWRYSRRVWVSDGPSSSTTMPWMLWSGMARDYGPKVLCNNFILAKNVKVSSFQGQKQLSGCSEVAFLDLESG